MCVWICRAKRVTTSKLSKESYQAHVEVAVKVCSFQTHTNFELDFIRVVDKFNHPQDVSNFGVIFL